MIVDKLDESLHTFAEKTGSGIEYEIIQYINIEHIVPQNTLFHAGHGKWLLYTVRRTAVFTLLCEKNAFQNCRERK